MLQLEIFHDITAPPECDPNARFISCGFGVQSTTIYAMACHDEFDPAPNGAVFADTGCEPQYVYDTIWRMAELWSHKIPIYIARYDDLDRRMIARSSGQKIRCPTPPFYILNNNGSKGHLRRQCTATYKLEAIIKETRRLLDLRPGQRALDRFVVEQWIGISTDEAHRMKPAAEKWTVSRWPLIERNMSRSDCLEWLAAHGYWNPGKSSCIFCMYHDDKTWAWMKAHRPNDFERACQFEETIQRLGMPGLDGTPYIHASRRPLRGIDFGTPPAAEGIDYGMGNECDGLCDT